MQTVPADDRGLTLGVGLFETILSVDGRLALWDAHLDRLERGCARLALPAPDRTDCAVAARDALDTAALNAGRAAVRLTWTGGGGARGLALPSPARPRLLITASPTPTPPGGLTLRTSRIRRNASSPTSRLKTLNYLDNVLARAEATTSGADEALMLDQDGSVACAAAANVFWIEGDNLCTPALECGVLNGVVRSALLRLAPAHGFQVQEVHAPLQRLMACEGAFLTNSLQAAVPVLSLDETDFAPPSPQALMLLNALKRIVEAHDLA